MKKRKRNGEFWNWYEDIAFMVAGYDQACDFCTWFILNKCSPPITATESKTDRVILAGILLDRYESSENYEVCAKLLPFKTGFDISGDVTDMDMEDYVFNVLTVLNYDANREECAEVFREYDLLAFNPWVPKEDEIDYVDVADRVLEYLRKKGELDICEYILRKRGQVLNYRKTGKLG